MRIESGRILDESGRTLILRGCNLGGDSKYPVQPDGASWRADSLKDREVASFVGRPFPAEEADEHFSRLASWGFTFLRLVITWEAIEHAGPGLYDEAYLAYLRKILKKAEEHGISVFMDPHQDVWSRWTGGDGAPAWTMEKLGIDVDLLVAADVALTQQALGARYPRMVWATNYSRYAVATMFTLFFAGNLYAPGVQIDGENVQDWLQSRYIAAFRHCYRRLKDCKAIVGWGTMNEPHSGWIGCADAGGTGNDILRMGPIPTALQAMAIASGHPTKVPVWTTGITGEHIRGYRLQNPEGVSIFREGFSCPWKQAGVWTDEGGVPRLLRRDHFALADGKPVRFVDEFLKPFMKRFAATLREVNPAALIFIEGIPDGTHPHWSAEDGEGFVNAFHWYDGATLITKSFRPWFSVRVDTRSLVFGRKAVAASFADQLANDCRWARERMGKMPSLLGEFGLPFDMNGKRSYRSGDYSPQVCAMSMYYDAVDSQLLHSTVWNYSASNTHENGDGWNGEDLSIWSREDGARGIEGWRRPYPMATAGVPLAMRWDSARRVLEYRFTADPSIGAATVLYAPAECFGGEASIRVEDERGQVLDAWTSQREGPRLHLSLGKLSGAVVVRLSGAAG